VEPEGERSLAAVMFVDMVGYTAVSQRSEALALELVDKLAQILRPIVNKHSGREIKTMGDAFLIEFPSAFSAIECAASMQKAMDAYNGEADPDRVVRIRIGIHVGDVIHRGNDVLGDAVNIASRIQRLAEPGGICVSGQVYDQVSGKVGYGFIKLPPTPLKNVSSPVSLYRVDLGDGRGPNLPTHETLDKKRIAVLPFANYSLDSKDEYLADGITEELISKLSEVRGLRVIARTSVARYKGSNKSVSEIAAELKAGSILEGSFRKIGDRIRVSVQLIDAETEEHLWVSTYDRNVDDIFAVQSSIASNVADALKARLLTGTGPSAPREENLEAYSLCLKARLLWNKRSQDGVKEALRLFQEAAKLDPEYARAYSGLADAYYIAFDWGYMKREEALPKAKEAAMKALQLDPANPEAHASLGLILSNEADPARAEEEFLTAIRLNPNYASAHQWYTAVLLEEGRLDEAEVEAMKAYDLDPFSPPIASQASNLKLIRHRFGEAASILDRLIQIEPAFKEAYLYRCFVHAQAGDREKAFGDVDNFRKFGGREELHDMAVAELFAYFGDVERAREVARELFAKPCAQALEPQHKAELYAALGEVEEFFRWVKVALDRDSRLIASLRYDPAYEVVRKDPRFAGLFYGLGLKP
jgi:TolB-like protein/Tfp pilus assembly protein PilF